MTTLAEKRATFRRLHESGCFVLPNPWDAGGARMLQGLGFQALASTSAGFAWSAGRADNNVTRDDVLDHLRTLCLATDLPINADFEGGFADAPDDVAVNVRLAIATGVAGLSIEDRTCDPAAPLYDLALAVDRVRAAREAIDAEGGEVILVARSEGFLTGRPDLTETISRLVAFAEAGADCLYAPGVRTREEISAIVEAVSPKPVNVLVRLPGLNVAELAELGVRRVSLGSALAQAAWATFIAAAQEIAATGTFDALQNVAPFPQLNGLFNPTR